MLESTGENAEMASSYHIIAEAHVDPSRVTGKTTHYRDGSVLPHPSRLVIAEITRGAGFYLLYFDDLGSELTDTWHESVEMAMEQARYEFGLSPGDWDRKKGLD
jgi:hypothetical protein